MHAIPAGTRRGRRPALIAIGLALMMAAMAQAAPRLDYHGQVLSPGQVEGLMQAALRSRSRAGAGPDSATVASALAAVVERLQDLGYLDARARARWDSSATRITLIVAEGGRARWKAVRIATAPPADSARFAPLLSLEPGGWASPRG